MAIKNFYRIKSLLKRHKFQLFIIITYFEKPNKKKKNTFIARIGMAELNDWLVILGIVNFIGILLLMYLHYVGLIQKTELIVHWINLSFPQECSNNNIGYLGTSSLRYVCFLTIDCIRLNQEGNKGT